MSTVERFQIINIVTPSRVTTIADTISRQIQMTRLTNEHLQTQTERRKMLEIETNSQRLSGNFSRINTANSLLLDNRPRVSIAKSKVNSKVIDNSEKLCAVFHSLSGSDTLTDFKNAVNHKLLPKEKQLLREVPYLLKTGNYNALNTKGIEIETCLNNVLGTIKHTQLTLQQKEIRATAVLVSTCLKEIGYHHIRQIKHKDGRMLVRGRNDQTSIYAEMTPRAEMKVDFAGFKGEACRKMSKKLNEKLKEKGFELQKKADHFHGKAEGGELVKETKPLFDLFSEEVGQPPANENAAAAEENVKENQKQKAHMMKRKVRAKNKP